MMVSNTQIHAMMQKLRDDARERGMKDLALHYATEACRMSALRLSEEAEKLGSSTSAQMRRE